MLKGEHTLVEIRHLRARCLLHKHSGEEEEDKESLAERLKFLSG
jgi:hypothetical protein